MVLDPHGSREGRRLLAEDVEEQGRARSCCWAWSAVMTREDELGWLRLKGWIEQRPERLVGDGLDRFGGWLGEELEVDWKDGGGREGSMGHVQIRLGVYI